MYYLSVNFNNYFQEGSGFVAVMTKSMVVFGTYSSSMYPSVCVEAVEKLGTIIIACS